MLFRSRQHQLPKPELRACTYLDQVDLREGLDIGRLDDVEDRDDVLVVEPPEELDLAERSEAEHCGEGG